MEGRLVGPLLVVGRLDIHDVAPFSYNLPFCKSVASGWPGIND